jgi:SAM-dependent methyltransferase
MSADPDRSIAGGGIYLPDELYMARKTFEFGTSTLVREDVQARMSQLLSRLPRAVDDETKELNRYWALEHALYDLLAKRRGISYDQYLPGRSYTYARFGEIIESLAAHPAKRILDIGCGSALLSRYIRPQRREYLALDISTGALQFASTLGVDHQVHITPVVGSAHNLPFVNSSIDVGVSLGVLEHFPHEMQVELIAEALRVCSDFVVFAVPNTKSAIFATMSDLEDREAGPALQFPLEENYFPVDFHRIATSCDARLLSDGAFHVVPPRYIPSTNLTQEERSMFSKLVLAASRSYTGSASDAWLSAESALPIVEKNRWGWFAYGAFTRTR